MAHPLVDLRIPTTPRGSIRVRRKARMPAVLASPLFTVTQGRVRDG